MMRFFRSTAAAIAAIAFALTSISADARFLSVDPAPPSTTDGTNFNRYWYANNNPYKYTDPDGRESGCIYGGGCGNFSNVGGDVVGALGAVAGALDALDRNVLTPMGPAGFGPKLAVLPILRALKPIAAEARAATLAANKAQGAAGEAAVAAKLGDSVAGSQVSFRNADGTLTRVDFVTTERSVVEVKTGNAQLSSGQTKLKADIDAGRLVTPVGTNAKAAGLEPGIPTTMTSCKVERGC